MPWLEETYKKRPAVIRKLVIQAKKEADHVILLSHYALAKATIIGEPANIWPEIYSPDMERVLKEARPDAAIHGHAHRGKPFALVGTTRVYNVALPLNKRIVPVHVTSGILSFLH